MNKIWTVASREYRTTTRTRSFVLAVVLMPVLMGGGLAFQALTRNKVDLVTKKIAVLDHSGKLLPAIQEAVAERNNAIVDKEGNQTKPKYEVSETRADGRPVEDVRFELSDRVRRKEIFAFLEIPADVLNADPNTQFTALRYHSQEPTYDDIQRWLSWVVNDKVRAVRFREAGLDKKIVDRAMTSIDVQNLGLFTRGTDGKIIEAKEVNEMATFMVPFALIMLMWMAIMMTTQPLLNGVIEEKMQKISEVLLGSIPPFQLMLGKLIGFVGVAITLVAIYMVGGYFLLDRYGYADLIPFNIMGWFLVFLSLAILMFGSLFLAAGACCNDLREAQNLVLPIWLILMIPFFTMGTVLQFPNSTFAMWISLLPPATPMLMTVRMAIPPGPPLWQPAVGIVGTLLTTLLAVWAAGRVFRIGLLMQGKPPKIGQIVRWVITG